MLSGTQAFAGPDRARHVVLVHGIHDTAAKLRYMEGVLHRAGLTPHCVTLTPPDGRAGLDELAAQLRDSIDSALPESERFSIIGFSMGGLISRYYVQRLANPERIDLFVSIASPHRGTFVAFANSLPGVLQMRPGSRFLLELDEDGASFDSINWITIRTPMDLMIVPSDSSVLPWAQNIVVPVVAHPLLVWDHRVINHILGALGVERLPVRARFPRLRHGKPRG